MCTICESFRPFDSECVYSKSEPVTSLAGANSQVLSIDQIASQLTTGYWGGSTRSFAASAGDTLTFNVSGLTAPNQTLARAAFQTWTDVSGLKFRESSNAQITLDDNDSGAYARTWSYGGTIVRAEINVDSGWNGGRTSFNSYTYQTFLHEIGHALGLGHAGNYNGYATYGQHNSYANDSWQASLMSYFSQTENWTVDASFAYTVTPMMADIVAVQSLYGASFQTRPGHTVYGASSNVDGTLGNLFGWLAGETPKPSQVSAGSPFALTIIDSAGYDTLNLRFYDGVQNISLRPGSYSDVVGLKGNLGIARGTLIEKAISGNGDDYLVGNAADNNLLGAMGDDVLSGLQGNDRLVGGNGNDNLAGGEGSDRIEGGSGRDTLNGGDGRDTLWGGAQHDTLLGGLSDDNLNGGDGNDRILGGDGSDNLRGDAGQDFLLGGNGADTIDGGSGHDRLRGDRGNDLFVFSEGKDTVYGFEKQGDNDTIDLRPSRGIADFADLIANHAFDYGTSLRIRDDHGNMLIIASTQISDVDASDFLF